jgi:UTP--glucose-1-phosphate uridylyltransferase
VSVIESLNEATRRTLDRYGFDEQQFSVLRSRVCDGSLSPASNVVPGKIEAPDTSDITVLPEPGEDGYDEARGAGIEALRAGAVASAVLNGGMATRFGGVVKGVVEAVDGKTFLELKLAQTVELAQLLDTSVPMAVMNSFATDQATRQFLAGRVAEEPLYFSQYVSLRFERDCNLFRTRDGGVSLYSPGHGDFVAAFRRSGTLDRLRSQGVRYVMVSNVDNIPARLDPAVIGSHIRAGRPLTIEVSANTGEVGGAPARVDGRLQILESMRFPPDFDHSSLPVTNVNTMTFDIGALDRDFELTWLYVEKSVDERAAVQLEHLYHEVTAFLPTTYLRVPVEGPRRRFLPVKKPSDLEAARVELRALMARPPLD